MTRSVSSDLVIHTRKFIVTFVFHAVWRAYFFVSPRARPCPSLPGGVSCSSTPLSPASPVFPQLHLLRATPGLLCLGIWPPLPEPQGLLCPGSVPHLWTPPALQAELLSVFSLPVLRAFARAAPLASTYYPHVTSQNFPRPAGWGIPPRWFSSSSPTPSCRGFL